MPLGGDIFSDHAIAVARNSAIEAQNEARQYHLWLSETSALRYALYRQIELIDSDHPLIKDEKLRNDILHLGARIMSQSYDFNDVREAARSYPYDGGLDSPRGIQALRVFLRSKGVDFGEANNAELDELVNEREIEALRAERLEREAAAARWEEKVEVANKYLNAGLLGALFTKVEEPTPEALAEARARRVRPPTVPDKNMRVVKSANPFAPPTVVFDKEDPRA